jgi:hypothetical protein
MKAHGWSFSALFLGNGIHTFVDRRTVNILPRETIGSRDRNDMHNMPPTMTSASSEAHRSVHARSRVCVTPAAPRPMIDRPTTQTTRMATSAPATPVISA